MAGTQIAPRLTPREREIARLIELGYTNREIGDELAIRERTVGAHVQNMLNKLTANNRAQIAAWSALHASQLEPRQRAQSISPALGVQSRARVHWVAGLLASLALVIAATDDGARPTLASEPPRPLPGSLVYEAPMLPSGEGFGSRFAYGDPTASDIRTVKGAVEYVILKSGGSSTNFVGMASMKRYYAEATLSVQPGTNVSFTMNLDSYGYVKQVGDHLISIETGSQLLQIWYVDFAGNRAWLPLGPQVQVPGLQSGRPFTLAALVDPPNYAVYLDGRRVISLSHSPSADYLQISFGIQGDPGTVRLTAMRVYKLSPETPT